MDLIDLQMTIIILAWNVEYIRQDACYTIIWQIGNPSKLLNSHSSFKAAMKNIYLVPKREILMHLGERINTLLLFWLV